MKKFVKLLTATAMSMSCATTSAATFVGDRDDFRDETIYFAMTTRFYDGDPTNNVCGWDHQATQIANNDPDWRGDFKGLIDKLDYIKALGFTAIWITPVVQNSSGTDFHGYHAMDFKNVDLRYESRVEWGASADVTFQSLIDAAHRKGIKIVLDIVLQHTGNFGEAYLNPLFTRSQEIRNQASPAASMIPNERLSSNYFDQDPKVQYEERWKYFKNPKYEPNNYYHHYGTGWNWDLPNRWWGQIAGDCVDLNTENDHVAQYIVDCYGKFIEMGVDGFRIDTTGHISRLTFNKQFIPQFLEIAERNKDKRLNQCPFFMFGECCQRFQGSVVYRGQPNLSSYYYTWKSDQSLLDQYDGDPQWWRQQVLPEGHDSPVGPMKLCEQETADTPTSDNVFLKNSRWHEPDYNDYSGFSVIDFPMHYSFNNAASAVNIAKIGDNKYNDASYNVVYVDSHDYCPGPNDLTRFNGGTAQWAENLSLMFTFRGIPCIYYGSEVEFKKGMKVDAGGTDNPVKDSGRAYFGNYIEGSVTATDFGEYKASGNVAATLDGDLAQHIRRLNMIRAAVPALRKGQYTFDGCSANGGWAFKRGYKDSYALVAINGGATFSNVPAGTYTDVVTGDSYDGRGGSVTVSAPATKGQLRVLVKDWNGGKIGEDGKFIYTSTPKAHGGNPSFDDPGTTQYYTAADAIPNPAVTLTPGAGSFKTETVTVSAALNESSTSGWYQIEGQAKVNLTVGETATFTIGADLAYGQSKTVTWSATDKAGKSFNGKAVYKKVDPNATITIYVTGPKAPNFYAWYYDSANSKVEPNGAWPGAKLTETVEIDGRSFYYYTFDEADAVNFIFNANGDPKTGNIEGVDQDSFYEWDGSNGYEKLDNVVVTKDPVVKFSPDGGSFVGSLTVTATIRNASGGWLRLGDGERVNLDSAAPYTFTIGDDMADDESLTVNWGASENDVEKTGSVVFTKVAEPVGTTVYYDNSLTNWNSVKIYFWGGDSQCEWPGVDMKREESHIWSYTLPDGADKCIFNNGGNGAGQTVNIVDLAENHLYRGIPNGDQNADYEDAGLYEHSNVISAVIITNDPDNRPIYYNLQGIEVANPSAGIYIERRGGSVRKVIVR